MTYRALALLCLWSISCYAHDAGVQLRDEVERLRSQDVRAHFELNRRLVAFEAEISRLKGNLLAIHDATLCTKDPQIKKFLMTCVQADGMCSEENAASTLNYMLKHRVPQAAVRLPLYDVPSYAIKLETTGIIVHDDEILKDVFRNNPITPTTHLIVMGTLMYSDPNDAKNYGAGEKVLRELRNYVNNEHSRWVLAGHEDNERQHSRRSRRDGADKLLPTQISPSVMIRCDNAAKWIGAAKKQDSGKGQVDYTVDVPQVLAWVFLVEC